MADFTDKPSLRGYGKGAMELTSRSYIDDVEEFSLNGAIANVASGTFSIEVIYY